MENMFYMVWSERSHETHKRHESEREARTEAERLARVGPGCKFYVLCAIGVAEQPTQPSIYRQLDDGIPF